MFSDVELGTRKKNFYKNFRVSNLKCDVILYNSRIPNLTFNGINKRFTKTFEIKKNQYKNMRVRKRKPPLKIFEVGTVIETKTKFSESKFFEVETKSINLLLGVTSLAPGLIKINKSKHMCFTINNMKNGNTQKEEIKS